MSEPTDPVLDPATVAELRRLQVEYANPAFITELVAIFRANAPARMAALREAVEQEDRSGLEHVAHTLKSNCGMLGAMRISALCGELERAGERGDFARAAAVLPEAEVEFARVLAAVENL